MIYSKKIWFKSKIIIYITFLHSNFRRTMIFWSIFCWRYDFWSNFWSEPTIFEDKNNLRSKILPRGYAEGWAPSEIQPPGGQAHAPKPEPCLGHHPNLRRTVRSSERSAIRRSCTDHGACDHPRHGTLGRIDSTEKFRFFLILNPTDPIRGATNFDLGAQKSAHRRQNLMRQFEALCTRTSNFSASDWKIWFLMKKMDILDSNFDEKYLGCI